MRNKAFRILVVDDIAVFRAVLVESLSAPGREVIGAPDIGAAIRHFGQRPFDLIVSDYSMPGGTGMDLLRQVRRIAPRQPFVLMSADLPRAVAREAQLQGVRVLEKHEAMVRLPAAFMSESHDAMQALFHSSEPVEAHPPALTHGVG